MLVVAMLCLPGLDAIAKGLAGEVSAGQIAWTRLVLQGLFLLPFMIRGGGFQITHVWKHAARGFLIATATLLFQLSNQTQIHAHLPNLQALGKLQLAS